MDRRSIAVVGVSHNPLKYGHRVFVDLIKNGYRVVGINPEDGEVFGHKLYKNLREVPRPIDLVITVVPPLVTEQIVSECKAKGVKELWMQPGSQSPAALAKARLLGIPAHAGKCFMVKEGLW